MDKVNTFHFKCFLLHDVGNNVMEYVISSHNKRRHITQLEVEVLKNLIL